jgi:hypothetical protein
MIDYEEYDKYETLLKHERATDKYRISGEYGMKCPRWRFCFCCSCDGHQRGDNTKTWKRYRNTQYKNVNK